MSGDFLEMITEVLMPERLGDELDKDIQYKAAIAEEKRLFELLNDNLNGEQQIMLKDYFDATCSTSSLVESFAYKLGMKDLLSLLGCLSIGSENILQRIGEKWN